MGTSELSVITKNKAFQSITIQLPIVVVNNFASVSLNFVFQEYSVNSFNTFIRQTPQVGPSCTLFSLLFNRVVPL